MPDHAPPPKLSFTWADMLLIALVLLCGMGAWRVAEGAVAPAFQGDAPAEESFQRRYQVAARRAELAQAERMLAVLEERRRDQRLEDMRQRAVTAAYEALYPQLRGSSGGPPAEVRSGYLNAKMTAAATQGFVQALERDVQRQDSAVRRTRAALREAERRAAAALAQARLHHARRIRWVNAACGIALTAVVLLLLRPAASWLARRVDVEVSERRAFGTGCALLLALLAYHLFGQAGAWGVAGLLLVAVLARHLWRARTPAGKSVAA